MERRAWLAGTGALLAGVAGCLGASEPDGDGNGPTDEKRDRSDPDDGATNATDGTDSGFERRPDGDAELTVRAELGPGFGEPEAYEVTLEVSRVELTRAGADGGARYDVDDALELRKDPETDGVLESEYTLAGPENGSEGRDPSEHLLVDRSGIPVATYDYVRLHGSVTASRTSDGGSVALPEGHLERTVGSVFEAGDHKEHVLQIAVAEAERGYEVTTTGMATITW